MSLKANLYFAGGKIEVREYREHFVAFLDILGFKAFIDHEACETIYQIFEIIHARSKSALNYNGFQIQAFEKIQHKILSDSVLIFIDAEIEDSFPTLLMICTQLQRALANREDPILLRGGIAKGSLYYEDDIIYGQGLTRAYLLESNLAKYPRVIFTGETLEAGRKSTKYMFPELDGLGLGFVEDKDGLYIDVISSGVCDEEAFLSLYITYGETSFFLEGNGDFVAERQMLLSGGELIKADVISVPHCGTKYLPSDEFLEAVTPTYAVIPVYGEYTPQLTLQKKITERGTEILRTDTDGTVTFVSDGKKVKSYHGK